MADILTPTYLQREWTAPALLQPSQHAVRASYSSLGERIPGRSNFSLPRRTLVNTGSYSWNQEPAPSGLHAVQDDKHPIVPQDAKTEDKYKRMYNTLTSHIAYIYPNPGNPRHREGAIGGTWRHVKEVVSYGGNRICFVDGLVSVYDNAKFTEKLQAQLPYRPHLKALLCPTIGDATQRPTAPLLPPTHTLPSLPEASIERDPNILRKQQLQERFQTSRKGFYKYPHGGMSN